MSEEEEEEEEETLGGEGNNQDRSRSGSRSRSRCLHRAESWSGLVGAAASSKGLLHLSPVGKYLNF